MISESGREVALLTIVALLAVVTSGVLLIDAAELQHFAVQSVHLHNPDDGERPALSLSFATVVFLALVPLCVLAVALLRRWSVSVFLAWMFAAFLVVLLVVGLASFGVYRYWHDYQIGSLTQVRSNAEV